MYENVITNAAAIKDMINLSSLKAVLAIGALYEKNNMPTDKVASLYNCMHALIFSKDEEVVNSQCYKLVETFFNECEHNVVNLDVSKMQISGNQIINYHYMLMFKYYLDVMQSTNQDAITSASVTAILENGGGYGMMGLRSLALIEVIFKLKFKDSKRLYNAFQVAKDDLMLTSAYTRNFNYMLQDVNKRVGILLMGEDLVFINDVRVLGSNPLTGVLKLARHLNIILEKYRDNVEYVPDTKRSLPLDLEHIIGCLRKAPNESPPEENIAVEGLRAVDPVAPPRGFRAAPHAEEATPPEALETVPAALINYVTATRNNDLYTRPLAEAMTYIAETAENNNALHFHVAPTAGGVSLDYTTMGGVGGVGGINPTPQRPEMAQELQTRLLIDALTSSVPLASHMWPRRGGRIRVPRPPEEG